MQTSVTFRHMNASDAIREHAIEKVARIKKYFEEPTEVHVVLSLERFNHKAEVNIFVNGLVVIAKEASTDMYNSIDRAMEKIEKQIKRYHSKLMKMRPRDGGKMKIRLKLLEAAQAPEQEIATELPPTIVETKEFEARPMMLDEAVMQMDLIDSDILVFLNAKTDHINVLYRKKNNKFGLIEAGSPVQSK